MSREYVSLTRKGRDKMCVELKFLKEEKRREIAKLLAEARAHGDLSENAEYDAAKEAQATNERKITEIESILIRARLIDEDSIPKDQALLGATIKIKDQDTAEECVYMLIAEEEPDIDLNKISVTSPVGKALLGHKKGDVVKIQVPAGTLTYKILSITR